MSGTIRLYHSELSVHTFALGDCRVTIRLLHSWAVTLPTVNYSEDHCIRDFSAYIPDTY